MHARMWGGLLQDTVSPLGDMVHYLAKASFLQDMLLGMFVILQKLAFCKICYSVCLSVFYLAKASFLQDMLLCLFVCFFLFFLYVIISVEIVSHTTSLTPI